MMKKILLMCAVLLTMVLNSTQAQTDSCNIWITQTADWTLTANWDEDPNDYVYWDNGQSGSTVYVQQNGTYCAILITSDSCVATDCFNFVGTGNPLDTLCWTSISIDTISNCLTANPQDSSAPYTFSWSNGSTAQSICPPSNQNYCVTVTDASGCESFACAVIQTTCSVEIVLDTIGNELGLTGIASGTAPFTFQWSTGENTQTINYDSTYYCLTVTDANGCIATDCWSSPASCNFDFIHTAAIDQICVQNITGVGPFEINWSTGETSNCITITESGYYSVTVSNDSGCYRSRGSVFTPQIIDTLCEVSVHSDWSGNLFVSHEGSFFPPYTYDWSNGETGSTIFPTDTVEYCVTVTNDAGCVAIACWDSLITDICQAQIIEIEDFTLCVESLGGTAPYVYSWNTGDSSSCIFINQYDYYSAVVTDATGCWTSIGGWYGSNIIDTICSVSVFETFDNCLWASPDVGSIWPYTYEWSDGSTTNSICPTDNETYCVTLTDGTGCESYACGFVAEGCEISIEIDTLSDGQITLTGIIENADVDSLNLYWNNGETEQTIRPEYSGEYCVNIWSIGCWDQACVTIEGLGCNVTIMDTLGMLYPQVNGLPPFTYEWSNGSTLSYLENIDAGNYCVTITDATGCTSESCIDFDPNIFFIEGWANFPLCANADSTVIQSGTFYLYKLDADNMPQLVAESAYSTWFPSYQFPNLEEGEYLVRVQPDPVGPDQDIYMPTYYESSLFWNEAETINIPYTQHFTYFDIDMQCAQSPPGGDGYIGGFIDDGEHNDDLDPQAGGPQEDVSVFLFDENGTALLYTMTNSTGAFFFDDLPWGTYEVVVEIPGQEQGRFWVTLGPDDRTVTLNINTNDNGMITDVDDLTSKIDLEVFPNPTKGLVNVQISNTIPTDALLQVVDLQGKVVSVKNLDAGMQNSLISVDLSGMSPGMYFIKYSDNNTFYTKKVILQ